MDVNNGLPPLPGFLPDMTATSDSFIRLQRVRVVEGLRIISFYYVVVLFDYVAVSDSYFAALISRCIMEKLRRIEPILRLLLAKSPR